MAMREALTVIVLGEGSGDAALGSAFASRAFASRVIIAERDEQAARQAAATALPPDVTCVACAWDEAEAAAKLLQEVDTPWTLFLAPGEGLDCDDRAALEREWRTLTPGAVEVRAGGRYETRLHPPGPAALSG